MSDGLDLTPAELVARRADTLILDIRRREERDEIGWVPGSRWVGESDADVERALDGSRLAVLACMSGRRSAAMMARFAERGVRVAHLAGGLLAWGAAGLPITHRPASIAVPPSEMAVLRKRLRSCFVVEAVQASEADEELANQAKAVVEELFPDDLPLAREALEPRIDRLAEQAWGQGHPLDAIVRNVESFYAGLAALP